MAAAAHLCIDAGGGAVIATRHGNPIRGIQHLSVAEALCLRRRAGRFEYLAALLARPARGSGAAQPVDRRALGRRAGSL